MTNFVVDGNYFLAVIHRESTPFRMSTFPGPLEEIELVSVDRFYNLKSTVYFLTHHHADHMQGMTYVFFNRLRNNDDIFLYCSPLTKLWLLSKRQNFLNCLDHKIKELPVNSKKEVKIPGLPPGRDPYLTVTALPAGHCPGSVMFLFSWESKHILYTGDIRMTSKDLEKMEPLSNISLDTLYLDTTFYSPCYGYLPPRKKSMDALVKFCKTWLDQNNKNVIDIRRPAGIGIESVYIDLYDKLGFHIHVTEDEWDQYGRIPDIAKALTTDKSVKTRIHACVPAYKSRERGALGHRHDGIDPERIRSIKLYALSARYLRENEDIVSFDHVNDLYKLVYSSHCSHNELKEIVAYLSPKKIIPCVVYDVTAQEIIDALRPNASPASIQTSSFESTFDLSPKKSSQDEEPVQNSSQTSITSISSIEETSTQPQTSSNTQSKRYDVPDSSDDEVNLSQSQSETSNGRWAEESPEKKPWENYMKSTKRLRRC